LFRLVKLQNTFRQIVVRPIPVLADPPPQLWQHHTKIKLITVSQNRQRRHRKIQDSNRSSRLAHPDHFGESLLGVVNISQSKSDGNESKAVFFKRQIERIRHRKMERRIAPGFLASDGEHFFGKVDAVVCPFDVVLLLLF
jgi:hypothetical protein